MSAVYGALEGISLGGKTEALIEEHRRREAIFREAKRQVDWEEAKTLAKKILAERNGKGSTWAPIDVVAAWEDAQTESQTDVGHLSGDMPLGIFYRGKINGVHAESEAGKSWLACLVTVQEIRARRHVAYIDFEDDAASIVRRLKSLGISREEIAEFFHYCNPSGPLTDADEREFQRLVALGGSLAIFDGMTEAMALEGLEANKAEDVAAWHARVTKAFAAAQWAVVVLDHVPHGGNRAIGSQHKKSALTGVSYFLAPVHPIGKGMIGKSKLKVEKDRPAWVRAHAVPGKTPQHFADLVIDFKEKATPTANLWPARATEDKGYESEPPERLRKS
ncbi:MAG: AAA family ATPase, partial [Streptomyces sp.]|uniref:AAA family ATPase n=1 Tax=Streptomyces sp. TaxID=1931 RepID=UPI0025FCAA78